MSQQTMRFRAYFQKHGYHIHRGAVPANSIFVEFLREALDDNAKRSVYQVYLDGTHRGLVERDYRVEYALYGSRADRRHIHKLRGNNRDKFEKLGLVRNGDGKHIHHKDGNVYNNKKSNLVVLDNCAHNKAHGLACVKTKRQRTQANRQRQRKRTR